MTTGMPLRDVCTFRSGGTPSKGNPEFWDGNIPWVSPKDMKTTLLESTQDFITLKGVEGSATSLVPKGSILTVVRSGILAHSVPFAVAGRSLAFNQDIKAIQVTSDQVTSEYVYWFLRSKEPEILTRGVKKGATVHSLQAGFLEKLVIPILPKVAQQKIVDLLARGENLVRLRREAEQKANAIMPALFLDMFHAGRSEKLATVEDCAAPTKGAMRTGPFGSQLLHSEFTSEGIAVLGIDNVVNNRFEWCIRRFVSREKYEQLTRYTVRPGDVLISIMGTCGRCAIVPNDIPLTINTKHLCAITLDTSCCLPEYLHGAFLFDPAVRRQLAAATKGAIMGGLNMRIIRDLKVRLPSIGLQRAYRVAADQYEDIRRTSESAMRSAEQAFHSLLAGVFGDCCQT